MIPRSFNEPWEPEDIFDRAEAEEFRARRARMLEQAAQRQAEEDRRREASLASAREFSLRANAHQVAEEYRRAGVAPLQVDAQGKPTVSLSLLLSMGWTIVDFDGDRNLVKPNHEKPSSRGDNHDMGS